MLISRIWSVATGGNKQNSRRYAILRPFEEKNVYVRGVQHKLVFRRFFALGPRTNKKLARMDNLRDHLYRLSPLYNVCILVQCTRYVDLPRMYSVQEQYKSCTCTYKVTCSTVSIVLEVSSGQSQSACNQNRGCN